MGTKARPSLPRVTAKSLPLGEESVLWGRLDVDDFWMCEEKWPPRSMALAGARQTTVSVAWSCHSAPHACCCSPLLTSGPGPGPGPGPGSGSGSYQGRKVQLQLNPTQGCGSLG